MKRPKLTDQSGFTIVELMIATVVFAVVLLVCTMGLLQISRTYYKGIISARTQETARTILEEVSEGIQLGGGTVEPNITVFAGVSGSCAGGKRYSYQLNKQRDDSVAALRHVLMVDDWPSCSSGTFAQDINAASVIGREMVPNRMRLVEFRIEELPVVQKKLYKVTVRVASGDDAQMLDIAPVDGKFDTCVSQRQGGQFCAMSELSTVVQKRL